MRKGLFSIIAAAVLFLSRNPAHGQDWPQLQCNSQRTGYTPTCPAAPYRVVWQWSLMPEDVLNSVAQPVATRKTVFMPTNRGMLYALAAKDGAELWKARIGRGCFHSAAVENNRVFAASLDGYVVAFDAETGAELWRARTPGLAGFVTAPLLAEGRIFLGDMEGNMLSLGQADGAIAWKADLGSPIVQTAAYNAPSADSTGSPTTSGSGQAGRVYVGSQDMRMRALDARTGETLWTSGQLNGMSMEYYHPVVHQGYVIVRTMLLASELGWTLPEIDILGPAEEWDRYFAERPDRQDMFILEENTGKEAFKVPHLQIRRRLGPVPPPCADAEGRLIMPIRDDFGLGYNGPTWGRLDLATRAIESIGKAAEIDYFAPGKPDKQQHYAGGNPDETDLFSAGGHIVFFAHDIESAQSEFQGYYDLDQKKWWFTGIGSPQGRIWRPPLPWETHPAKGSEYTGLRGFRGMGGYSHHAFAITETRLYHHSWEVLAAWASADDEKGE